jgi:hypothetical protein
MKNNKFAIGVWFVFNVLLIELLLLALREVSGDGGAFLYCASLAIYAYAFSFCWDVLQTHINDANEIKGIEVGERNDFLRLIDSLTKDMLDMSPLWLWLVPVYYWMFRIALLLIGWLINGEWSTFTTCDAIPAFCYFESKAVGLNKIVHWLAEIDFGFFLLMLCGLLGWITLQRKDSN